MRNPKFTTTLLFLFCVSFFQAQYLGNGPEFLARDFLERDRSSASIENDMIIDNPLGIDIGMIQVLDPDGRLFDAVIVRCDKSRISLKNVKVPTGNYVLILNTMLGFSFSQEVEKADF